MKKTLLTSVIALGFTGAVFAQATAPTDFASVDTNMDTAISLEEAQVAWPDLTAEAFAAADTDGNGSLSAEEYNALIAANAS